MPFNNDKCGRIVIDTVILLKADLGTPEREDSLLGPLRPLEEEGVDQHEHETFEESKFDPSTLEPDLCKVKRLVNPRPDAIRTLNNLKCGIVNS